MRYNLAAMMTGELKKMADNFEMNFSQEDYMMLLERCAMLETRNAELTETVSRLNAENAELKNALNVHIEQIRFKDDEIKIREEEKVKIMGWLSDLTQAKEWYINQISSRDEEIQRHLASYDTILNDIAKYQQWLKDMEESRDYYKNHSEALDKDFEEMRAWVHELEEARDYFKRLYEEALEEKLLIEVELERMTDAREALDERFKALPASVRRLIKL